MTPGYDQHLGYDDDDEDDLDDLDVGNNFSTTCDVCGAPVQVAPDHQCRQCAAHCAVAAYRRRAGAT